MFGHPLISFDHLKLFSRCLHLCLTSDIQISLSASLPREPYSVCMILLKHHEVSLHVLSRRYRCVGGLTLYVDASFWFLILAQVFLPLATLGFIFQRGAREMKATITASEYLALVGLLAQSGQAQLRKEAFSTRSYGLKGVFRLMNDLLIHHHVQRVTASHGRCDELNCCTRIMRDGRHFRTRGIDDVFYLEGCFWETCILC